ncbi:hypothetical protein JCM10212_002629 [Sporobolomyces blumeae]
MPSKKQEGQARKAAQADEKKAKQAAAEEAKEAEKWQQGAKGKNAKQEDKAAKDAAAKARKAEAARLLAEEEASLPSKPKPAPSKTKKPAARPTPSIPSFSASDDSSPQSFSASGIDDALDMLSLVGAKTDKASVGSQAAKIETHPERRFKAAFEAYKEEQLPILKKEHPGLRLQQYQDKLYESFKKSPQNPFNQTHMSHNATKQDKVAALEAQKAELARRLASN